MSAKIKVAKDTFKKSVLGFVLILAMVTNGFQMEATWAAENEVWNPIDTSPVVIPESALDLSFMNDAPAGKHGFLKIDAEGNYYFENDPGKTVRFYGANLLNGALFGTHQQSVVLADRMAKMGYNVIRIHAQDWMESWAQGIFKKPVSKEVELDLDKLDKLDYLIAKLKERGIYVKIDIITFFNMNDVPELENYQLNSNVLAQLIPDAYEVWQSAADQWLSHVNPYTGLALKDDPVLVGVSPWNESLLSQLRDIKPSLKAWLLQDFNQFLTAKGRPTVNEYPASYWAVSGSVQNSLAEYLTVKTLTAYDQMKNYLKNDLGVKAPIGGLNHIDSPLVSYWRTHADAYETHVYSALVQTKFNESQGEGYKYNPFNFPRLSAVFSQETADHFVPKYDGHNRFFDYYPTLSLRQQYGRPFELTEFNDGLPIMGREEIGIFVGAVGAYQNWDVLNRFEFGGEVSIDEVIDNVPYANQWLSMAADPLGILSEIEATLLFRGDVLTPSQPSFVIVRDITWSHTTGAAHESQDNIMNLSYIPHLFNTPTVFADKPGEPFAIYKITPDLTAQQIANGDIPAANKLNITSSMTLKEAAEVMINSLDDTAVKNKMLASLNQNKLISDTGELVFDLNLNTYLVDTSKVITAAGVLDNHIFDFDQGSIQGDVDKGTFFAASLDEQALADSDRILAIYTTDVRATNDRFSDPDAEGNVKYYKGILPTLTKMNSVKFDLNTSRNAADFQAYKLGMNGQRLERLPVTSTSEDIVSVTLSTDNGYAFEIVYDPDFEADTVLPTKPTNVSGTAVGSSEIRLSWTASEDNTGVTEYRIYRDGNPEPVKVVFGTTTTYADIDVVEATPYSYTVRAADLEGNLSEPSDPVVVTTPTYLLKDDFEDGDANGWRAPRAAWSSLDSMDAFFEVVDLEGNKVFTNTTLLKANSSDLMAMDTMENGTLSGKVRFDTLASDNKAAVGIAGRRHNWTNGYMLIYYVNQHKLTLAHGATANIQINELGSANLTLPANQYHNFELFFNGTTIKAYVNGEKQIEVTDATYGKNTPSSSYGPIAVLTFYGQQAYFDDIKVDPRTAFTVAYDANGGTGGVPTDSGSYTSGTDVTVQFDTLPSRPGYTFSGWAATNSATTAEYTENGATTFQMAIDDMILYAVWEEMEPVPRATIVADGTTKLASHNVELTISAEQVQGGFTALEATIQYDPQKLEFATEQDSSILAASALESLNPDFTIAGALKAGTGQIQVIMIAAGEQHAITAESPLFKLRGKVKEDAGSGSVATAIIALAVSMDGENTVLDVSDSVAEFAVILPDKTGLVALIDEADDLYRTAETGNAPGQYPESAKTALQAAIDSAISVRDNASAIEAQVQAAIQALDQAISSFRQAVNPEPEANKAVLQAAIATAQGRYNRAQEGDKIGQYSLAAKNALQTAIASAQTVANNAGASQSAVDAAVAALDNALQTFATHIVTLVPGETRVSIKDLSIIAKYFGTTRDDTERWSEIEQADLIGDGEIGIEVLAAVARMILNDWLLA